MTVPAAVSMAPATCMTPPITPAPAVIAIAPAAVPAVVIASPRAVESTAEICSTEPPTGGVPHVPGPAVVAAAEIADTGRRAVVASVVKYLGLSRLGGHEQTTCCEQSDKRFHAWNLSAASDFRHSVLPMEEAALKVGIAG